MLSRVTPPAFTLASPWRRDAPSRQNLGAFTQPDVPSGGALGWCPSGEATRSSDDACHSGSLTLTIRERAPESPLTRLEY